MVSLIPVRPGLPAPRSNFRAAVVGAILALAACLAFAAGNHAVASADELPDAARIAALLAEPILAPGTAEEEHRVWCEARVARWTPPTDADTWRRDAESLRQKVLDEVVLKGIPESWRPSQPPPVVWHDWQPGVGYRFRKLRYEALPGLWIPAILYEPTGRTGELPVALHVNGHDPLGKAAVYKQIRSINLAKRGVLTLNVEWLGMGQLRGDGYAHGRMNQLELCGVSGLAPFYLAMQRGLDVLLAQPNVDIKRVAVSGLSGGGWQTILLSALDPRVTASNPVAGYSSFLTRLRYHSDLGDSEQTPTDLARYADYTHLTALRAPRPMLLTYNIKDDCCFASAHALPPLLDAAAPVYKLLDATSRLASHINETPGTHNYELDNREAWYGFLADHFAPPGVDWPKKEIDCRDEVRTADELKVELPVPNADFHSLAQELARDLPRRPEPMHKLPSFTARDNERQELAAIVRTPLLSLDARSAPAQTNGELRVVRWKLRIGESWTVPAVELIPADAKGFTLVVADGGRKVTAETVRELLRDKRRVIAFDPFYWGESAFQRRAYLFSLLVDTVGERSLGLQARQIEQVANWTRSRAKEESASDDSIRFVAIGPRASLAGLVAAALRPQTLAPRTFATIELRGGMKSLREPIDRNWSYDQAPECFCMGLYKRFDMRDLVELAAPTEVQFRGEKGE